MLRKEQSASVSQLRRGKVYLSFLFSSTLPTCLLFIFSLALIASAVAAVSAAETEAEAVEAAFNKLRLLSVFKLRDKIARGCKKRLTTRRAAASAERHSPRDASRWIYCSLGASGSMPDPVPTSSPALSLFVELNRSVRSAYRSSHRTAFN